MRVWMPDDSIERDFDRFYEVPCPNCWSSSHRRCDPDAVYDDERERALWTEAANV